MEVGAPLGLLQPQTQVVVLNWLSESWHDATTSVVRFWQCEAQSGHRDCHRDAIAEWMSLWAGELGDIDVWAITRVVKVASGV